MTALLLLGFLGLQAAFIHARYTRFRIDGPAPRGVRLIEAATVGCIVVGVALIARRTQSHAAGDAVAVLLVLASAAMFTWACRSVRPMQLSAVFSTDLPQELVHHGAFRVVRNPFYVAYILAQAVPLAASLSPWGLLPVLCMTTLYWRAVLLEEAKFLRSPLAPAWREYARCTGRFVPRFLPVTFTASKG